MSILEALSNFGTNFIQSVRDGDFYTYLLPTFVGMLVGERLLYIPFAMYYNAKEAWTNVIVSTMNMVVDLVISVIVPFTIFAWIYSNIRLFTLPDNTWWAWVIAFLAHDLCYYLDHRVAHRTGLFWAFHQVHHSSEEYNLTVAARGFLFNGTILIQPIYVIMPLIGMSMFHIVVVVIFTNLYGIFVHTKLVKRMGIFEYFMATPSNHRVHHGSDIKYLDKNYGQVLIIWDLIFGSFKMEEEEPTYGLTKNIETKNPIKIQFTGVKWLWEQIQSADKFSDKFKYLYMPPGWRHDGKGETAEDLRRELIIIER
jgi:sterol desaturase/sphingolipid hydroxylase (fatty acid hydroxylase superfamily)